MSDIVVIFIAAGVIAVGVIITNICIYHSFTRTTTYPVMKYKEFKSIFNISPDKWDYYDEYIKYNGNYICMSTLCGLLRAKLDLRNKRNKEYREESLEAKKKLIKLWQQDIDEYKQKAIEETKKQLKETGLLTFTPDKKDIAAILQYLSSNGVNKS